MKLWSMKNPHRHVESQDKLNTSEYEEIMKTISNPLMNTGMKNWGTAEQWQGWWLNWDFK